MSSGFEFDVSNFFLRSEINEVKTRDAAETAMGDAADDLLRISSNIAPIDKGTLRKAGKRKVTTSQRTIIGEVSFSATEKSAKYGRFNYALWTHEMTYKLGERSQQAKGTDGYSVGNKYLSRPLNGEAEKYWRWIAESVKGAVDS